LCEAEFAQIALEIEGFASLPRALGGLGVGILNAADDLAGGAAALAKQGARQAARKALQQAAQPRLALRPVAQWGAGYYRHGGLMTTVEHITYRHAWETSWQGTSRFLRGTTAREIVEYAEQALSKGQWIAEGAGRYRVRFRLGRPIGVDIRGNLTDAIEVWVREGIIRTAYTVTP